MKKIVSFFLAAALMLSVWSVSSYAQIIPADNATSTDIVGTVKDIDKDGVIRVACVGDSITAGDSGCNYPLFLQEYLTYLGKKDGNTYVVKNHGKGGAACRHIEEDVGTASWDTVTDANGDGRAYFYYDDIAYTSSLTYTPDVVIVQMGTNDALFDNWANWDNYFANDYYNYLVKPYADKGALVVLSTPPYAENGWHNENVNGPVHDKEVALAKELGLPIIDTNRLLYGMPEILKDGLHGNLTGYSMMAMNFYKYIFGGDSIELTLKAEPQTRFSFYCKENKRTYSRTTDKNGVATIDFIPGSYTFTNITAECTGFKTAHPADVSFSANKTVTIEQAVGGFNVALDGTAIACEAELYDSAHNANTIIDGSRADPGYQPKNWNEGDWCGVLLDKAYDVNMMVLYWENASYISEYQDGGYEIHVKIGDNWRAISETNQIITVTRAVYSGDTIADTIVLDPAMNIEGVKVEFLNGTIENHKYAPKLYELEVLCDNPNGGVPGDVDGDTDVDADDLTILARHVGQIETITDARKLANADLDTDNDVDADDLTKLARVVAKIDTL